MGNPNSKKHKANHCGYKKKPTKGEVNALLGLYAGIALITDSYKETSQTSFIPKPGTQLSLF
jgi:hypothetical protein